MQVRKILAAAMTSAVAAAAAAVALPAPPASADTPLGLAFRRMVVDESHNHVYLSQGPGTELVTVTDLDGTKVGSIGGQGVTGMTLSPDGSTLYLALSDASAISAVDTRTLQQTARYQLPDSTQPRDVVAAGGRLWFSYLNATGQLFYGGLGSVDLSGDTPTVTIASDGMYEPAIIADPADPGLLVLATDSGSIAKAPLRLLDVSSGTPVQKAVNDAAVQSGERQMTVTPDGRDLAVADGSKAIQLFSLPDLTPDGSYPLDDLGMAVAVAPDGAVAAGTEYTDPDGLSVFAKGAASPRRTFGEQPKPAGLAWSSDGTRLYSVVEGSSGPVLRVHYNAEQSPTAMALDAPAAGVPGVPYTVKGRMTSPDPFGADQAVYVTRVDAADPGGTRLPDAAVAADGSFAFTDTLTDPGDVTYRVSYGGDRLHMAAQQSASVTFAKAAGTLVLQAPATAARGSLLHILGTLSSPVPFAAGTVLHVSRTDAQGTTALPDIRAGAGGELTVSDTPPSGGSVAYTVTFPGDVSHDTVTATATVQVSRTATDLSVATDAPVYGSNAVAAVTARLGTTYGLRTVSLYAQPSGGTKTLVATGTVDAHGEFTATFRVTRSTTFSAVFAGDDRYAPAAAWRTVRVYARAPRA